jgi:hypothetical protein
MFSFGRRSLHKNYISVVVRIYESVAYFGSPSFFSKIAKLELNPDINYTTVKTHTTGSGG